MAKIPSIDLAGFDFQSKNFVAKKQVGQSMIDAFSGLGVVKLEGTGLGLKNDIMRKAYQAFNTFFANTKDAKQKYSMKPNVHGYVVFNGCLETTNLKPDHLEEHFNVRGAACTVDDEDQYPWPDDLSPGFSTIVKKLMENCRNLSLFLIEALALGLGLEESHFTKVHSSMHSNDTLTTLGCLNCTCTRESDHEDLWHKCRRMYITMALLFQDEMKGLQFQNLKDGGYVNATPGDDDVYVIVGDILSIWTNNLLKVSEYRKVVSCDHKGNKAFRQNMIYFVACNNDAVACDLNIGSGKALEITTATNDEQLTTEKLVTMNMAKIADLR